MPPIVCFSMCVPAAPKRSNSKLDQRTRVWQVVSESLAAHCPLMLRIFTFCSQLFSALCYMLKCQPDLLRLRISFWHRSAWYRFFSLTSLSLPAALEYSSCGPLCWPLYMFLFTYCLDLCFLFLLWLSKAILTMHYFLPYLGLLLTKNHTILSWLLITQGCKCWWNFCIPI